MPPVFPKSLDRVFWDICRRMISDYRGCISYILRQMPPSAVSHGMKNGNTPMGSSSFLWDFQKLMKDCWRAKNVAESLAYSGSLYFPPRFLSPSFWGRSCPDLKILFCLFICFVSPSTLLDNFLFSEFGFSPPEKKESPFVVQIFIYLYFFYVGGAGQTLSLDLQEIQCFSYLYFYLESLTQSQLSNSE